MSVSFGKGAAEYPFCYNGEEIMSCKDLSIGLYTPPPEQQFYNEGMDAFEKGLPKLANPYRTELEALCWAEGWDVAKQYKENENYYG